MWCSAGDGDGRIGSEGVGGREPAAHLWLHAAGRLHLLDGLAAAQHRARAQTQPGAPGDRGPAAGPHGDQGHIRPADLR